MKKILFMLFAAFPFVAATAATETTDTLRAYFIDGKYVKNFTGKELVGKTIASYDILYAPFSENENGPWRTLERHKIVTQGSADGSSHGVVRVTRAEQVYIVNGKVKSVSEVNKIPTYKIESIHVYKKGSDNKYTARYGKKVDVIEITTK